jgi:hypothetical protein
MPRYRVRVFVPHDTEQRFGCHFSIQADGRDDIAAGMKAQAAAVSLCHDYHPELSDTLTVRLIGSPVELKPLKEAKS